MRRQNLETTVICPTHEAHSLHVVIHHALVSVKPTLRFGTMNYVVFGGAGSRVFAHAGAMFRLRNVAGPGDLASQVLATAVVALDLPCVYI